MRLEDLIESNQVFYTANYPNIIHRCIDKPLPASP